MEIPNQYIKNIYRVSLVFLVILSLFFAVKLLAEFRSYNMMGSSGSNTITLSGHGEVQAVPDIANVYFTISKDAAIVKDAQDSVAVIEKKALELLKAKGVEDKDVKTANASFYPKYEYRQALCPRPLEGTPATGTLFCPGGKQVIIGYTASESITVKVRKIDDAGAIMQELGAVGVTDLNGPNFTIDKEDSLKAEARKKAIDDARVKAEVLANDLGVSLGRISTFSEGGSYGGPVYYAKSAALDNSVSPAPAPAQIPKGENTISSDVTITYEIK
ncbi:MAG TPA: SIMPL domain-containing protein [Candidatus Paceibacterota bacterium]|nr:SIMPL domain-containing protein [Candidatus Paceibacterota bacterium]